MSDAEAFVRWADERGLDGPARVTKKDLREYLVFMTNRGDARTSIIRRRASLRGYFAWLVERGDLDFSPADRLLAPTPRSKAAQDRRARAARRTAR